jgi:Zn-dependent protease
MLLSSLFSDPLLFLVAAVAILASLSFHEFCHAAMALYLGDDTAHRSGRLTLNPLAHVDMLGLAAILTIGFGWGKPVPFNPYNLRNQKWGPVLVAFAGPLSNLVLFTITALTLRLLAPSLSSGNALTTFLIVMAQFNAALFLFNLIPIPPLDGSKFLLSALDGPQHARTRFLLETRGPMYLLVLILADTFLLNGAIFGALFGGAIGFMFRLFGLGA